MLGAGCSAFETNLQDTEVSYQATARQNFEEGQKALDGSQYNESIKFFEHVKNKYPYSKYAVLAELRIADAHYAREKWLEAADAYRTFTRFHPRHEQVPYALWRVASAYYKAMPSEWFFLPSPREKDPAAVKDAIRAFDDYLTRFPNDEHAAEARTLRADARARLAESDLYAAQFYAQREKWQGAMWRYERVAKDFGDTEGAPRALLEAGRIAEDKLDRKDEAKTLYARLVAEHPDAPEAAEAKERLTALGGEVPAPTPTPTPTPTKESAPVPATPAESAAPTQPDAPSLPTNPATSNP